MNKMARKVMAVVMAVMIWISSAVPAFAETLQEETPAYNASKAVIVMEDLSNKGQVQVFDLSGIKKMSQAKKMLTDIVPGRNVRIVSVDRELLGCWASAAEQVGFKPKAHSTNPNISTQAQRVLKPSEKFSFELKTKKGEGGKIGWKEGLGIATAVAGIWAVFR